MGNNYKYRSDRNSGGLFASTVVLTIAVFGGIMVAYSAFSADPWTVWGIGIGAAVLILLMNWLLRDRPSGTLRESFGWLSQKNPEPQVDYEPKLVRADRVRYGTKRPPTAEEVRDLKDGDRNWVPSNTPAGNRRKRRK